VELPLAIIFYLTSQIESTTSRYCREILSRVKYLPAFNYRQSLTTRT